jgi:peptide/nickel transport system permease protein
MIYGLRISLEMGMLAGAIALTIGATMGVLAAFLGGRFEALVMRIVDLQLSFPAILLALVLSALLGKGKGQLVAALVAAQYAYFARTAHGAAVAERGKDYVEAALSVPLPVRRVIFRHILPNCLPPLIVVATVQVANSIALEATLSFLGLGLPATEPSLGMLIANGFQYLLSGRYWISIYPGIALIILIVSINVVGDQIRDQLNPRLKR